MSLPAFDRCLPPGDRNDAPMLARIPVRVSEAMVNDIVQLGRTLRGAQSALDRLTKALGDRDDDAARQAAWELNEALMTDTRAVATRLRNSIAGASKRRITL